MAMRLLDHDAVDLIVIHITASKYGNVDIIERWHKQKGFDQIGYHWLILNAFPTYRSLHKHLPDPWSDGKARPGRNLKWRGAHVRGHNRHSVGIALVGEDGQFTRLQLQSAVELCHDMQKRFPSISRVVGHTELDAGRSCPDLDMDQFRWWVEGGWKGVG